MQAAAAIFKIDNLSTTLFKNDSSHDKLSRHGCDNKYESASHFRRYVRKRWIAAGLKKKQVFKTKTDGTVMTSLLKCVYYGENLFYLFLTGMP